MNTDLRQVLADPRGGPNRARILRALDAWPRNANRLAEHLDLNYETVRYHLGVLEEAGEVRSNDADYGKIYLPSDRADDHWDTVEGITEQLNMVQRA